MKINLKKKMVAFLMMVTTCAMLTACGGEEEVASSDAVEEQVETVYRHVEITVKDYGTIKYKRKRPYRVVKLVGMVLKL